jgi:hypothetical protein
VERRLKGPRHQFGDAADRVAGGDPGEDVGEISLRIDAVYFAVCRLEYITAARSPPDLTAGE